MTVFAYRAVDAKNKVIQGRLECRDIAGVVSTLTSSGQIALDVREVTFASRASHFGRTNLKISIPALTGLLSEIAMLLRSGMPLERALSLLENSQTQKSSADLAKSLNESVKSGSSLSQALRASGRLVPPFISSVVAAGEASGYVEVVLGQLVSYLERSEKARSDFRSALVYPLILLAMSFVAISILMLVLIPKFKPLFEGAEDQLPTSTLLILTVADYFGFALAAVLVATASTYALARYAIRSRQHRLFWHRSKLRLPASIGSMLLESQIAMFSRLLSLLLQNGVVLEHALTLTRDAIPNLAIARMIETTRLEVRKGGRLSTGLAADRLLPAMTIDLIKVGEEASKVPDTLARISDLSELKVERALKRLMDILVPAITVGLGAVIASTVASILMALLSINDLALR